MPTVFDQEIVVSAGQPIDKGKLPEINNHELLKTEDGSEQIATFDQVRAVGRWFLNQDFNTVLPSSQSLPLSLLSRHELNESQIFLGKLALGTDSENHFPVTVGIVDTPTGKDLKMQIVPIHFKALEVAQFGQHTDSLLALAAAAAVAPQFVLALEGGIETTHCATKKENVTSITPDHGTPLAVTFDAFNLSARTLNSAISVTNNPALSIKQAAHLHGKNKPDATQVSQAAGASKIAAGVPIRTVLRSQLPRHALFITTQKDAKTGEKHIISLNESLWSAGINNAELSLLAAALGFTAQVVGDSTREQTVERILTPSQADTPLGELVN